MRVIIVGRDTELIKPLADRLTEAGFTIIVSESSSAALSVMKKTSVQFVIADTSLLIDQHLAREMLKRAPLVRLVGFSARPSIPAMIEALTQGLIDYFPRSPERLEDVVEAIVSEGRRLARWQRALILNDAPPPKPAGE